MRPSLLAVTAFAAVAILTFLSKDQTDQLRAYRLRKLQFALSLIGLLAISPLFNVVSPFYLLLAILVVFFLYLDLTDRRWQSLVLYLSNGLFFLLLKESIFQ